MDVELLKKLQVGDKVTFYIEGIGGTYEHKGTITKEAEPYGFVTPGGGWALYSNKGDVQTYSIGVRQYSKQKNILLKSDYNFIDFKLGWD